MYLPLANKNSVTYSMKLLKSEVALRDYSPFTTNTEYIWTFVALFVKKSPRFSCNLMFFGPNDSI